METDIGGAAHGGSLKNDQTNQWFMVALICGMLVLCGCNDGVLQVLNVLGLNNVFPLAPDVQTALRAF